MYVRKLWTESRNICRQTENDKRGAPPIFREKNRKGTQPMKSITDVEKGCQIIWWQQIS